MKVADEPAYLTVGTDVSAKYRGAFCEAKIKTVKRMVKVKVVLKGESTSQVVQDDQVKGPLRVGSTVEVKIPECGLSEAVISKLTDASWYTVVFDDGDEKTLRRTSLCLKGERHFAESESLDQLPLTNPEHFGTPVIGKKTNRGRRSSQAVAEDENESSSSEDDDDDRRRLNDDLLGKVACIQSESDSNSWYYALVVSPSCNDELTVKKDQCLVRSFADSKFHIVARREVQEVNLDTISNSENSNRKGVEAAQHFLKDKKVPDSWKVDLSEILESSSSDEDDEDEDVEGKESEEEEKEPEPEEPDDEPDPEERDHFLQQLYKFMDDRGTPINKPPVLGYKDLNLFKLFRLVYHQGGFDNIESGSIWKQIYMDLGIPVLNSAASYNVKTAYRKYLYGFEEYCRSAQIQFRTVHHNEPRPDGQPVVNSIKTEKEYEETEEVMQQDKVEPGPSEDKPLADGDESDAESEKGQKDICSPRGRRRCTLTPVKVEGRDLKEEKKKEEAQGTGEYSGEELKEKADGENSWKCRSRRLEESDDDDDDEPEDDENEDEDGERPKLRDRDEREEDDGCEDSEHSMAGTKVKVKYGKGKTQKIYEANIKNTETDDGEVIYLVHYFGWNVRYDEWVKADRIIWPVDKGGTKRKQKKKVKNKDDGEEDKQAKMGIRRGRPPLKSTPPGTSRSVSNTPSSEGRSSSKNSRPSDASVLPNGDSTPRRRTRRTSGMYDSDRGSNDSGNSSDDSECEDSPEKKAEWTENTDQTPTANQEAEEELQEDSTIPEPAQPELQCPNSPQEMPNFQKCYKPEEDTSLFPESDDGSPKSRAKKLRPRDTGSEPPTQTLSTANHTETEEPSTPPRPVKKPQEAPYSSPIERIVEDTAGSDTDSATEDIVLPERSSAIKRKATEHRTPEKKVRSDRKEDPKVPSPMKTPPLEKKSEVVRSPEPAQKPEEHPTPTSSPSKDLEIKSEMPALTREVQIRVEPLCTMLEDSTRVTNEEMMPQIGPEALVCHEVDLDDPEEKDKLSGEELLMMMMAQNAQTLEPSNHLPHVLAVEEPPRLISQSCASSPEESHSTKSESDATIEVDSVAESQEGLGENESTHSFDASASSSNSSISLQERDGKERGQKRLLDCTTSSSTKKQKRSQKRSSAVSKTEKNGAGHSSDSEDLSAMDSSNKLTPVKHSSLPKSQKLSRSPGMVSPSSKDLEKDKHKEKQSIPSPRTYKWSYQLTELDNMSSTERISFLQEKLQEIRKYYMSLKSEVASIDRRRKRLKKKEREVSHTTASTSSGSSDNGMSPSSASPTQNNVAVECR
ncbi:AT-rich interactive domain-containing protein 4A-like [Xyrauchen texanus]|uniref:AT-rich interactive domain-containing protein 4A-like n=1 Tax=Xyrauchen texanus TaxID=154827 RepID=UPI002241C0DF|nr:AT-rich interactive domain-containing protein 4A-like [Xyrauchen texanus]XP_052009305.1 AT-rich interactive domain-containing protein 4A-like [Xyrauchen texanus]XP_052009306.1 AT-rich interactive domain-containing protein 4A-like [Xyrauchen texanus]